MAKVKPNWFPFFAWLVACVVVIIVTLFFNKVPDKKVTEPKEYKISLGEGQLSCKIAEVYNKEKDKCEPAFPPKEEVVTKTDPPVVRTTKVLDVVTAKKGQGCIALTKKTWLPLDQKACEELAEKYNRTNLVKTTFNGRFVEVVIIGMIVQEGEQWYFIEDEKGDLMWKIPNG